MYGEESERSLARKVLVENSRGRDVKEVGVDAAAANERMAEHCDSLN